MSPTKRKKKKRNLKKTTKESRPKKTLTRHDYNGIFFNSANSLRTTDQCMAMSLLGSCSSERSSTSLSKVHKRNNMMICEIKDVLTKQQCKEIINSSNLCNFQDMSNKYDATKQRNNSRLLVLDPDLSKYLWNQIEVILSNIIRDYVVAVSPLGFDVLRGNWEFSGLNEALRINKYSSKRSEFFAPHKDAQYCPSGDERSMLSLVLYLNDDFIGGETCFYLPKDMQAQTKGMTVDQEIEAHRGLENGFDPVKIIPVTGSAVLFSQNILHESVPLRLQQEPDHKFILKTDVMLKRKDKPFGFSVSVQEKEDYFECLNYFREAQQHEIYGKNDEASQLYERALSIRYCYPSALENTELPNSFIFNMSSTNILPSCVWENILCYLNGQDAERLIYAFPDLRSIKKLHDKRFISKMTALFDKQKPMFYPKVEHQHGIYTCFQFPDTEFFKANEEGCCRVAAMYSFFLLGHTPSDNMYPVRFNPDTQEVCVLPLDSLLWNTFYNQPCYGAIYKIKQQDEAENPCKDFSSSVDRNYMVLRHSAEFIGVDVADTFVVKTTIPEGVGNSDDSDDADDEDESDNEDESSDEDESDNEDESNPEDESNAEDESDSEGPDNDIERGQGIENVGIKSRSLSNDRDMDTTKSDIYLRMVDKVGSYKTLDIDNEEDSDRTNEIIEEFTSCLGDKTADAVKTVYLNELLFRNKERASISTSIVSSLDEPVNIDKGDVCFCCCGTMPGDGCSDFSDKCKPRLYNHLIFDFQESQLTILKVDNTESACCSTCFLDNVLTNHVEKALKEKARNALTRGKMKHFTVKIDALAEAFVPFNHASCQCGFPAFRVDEYVNLKDYPYLNHMHLIVQDIDDEMYVWSVYCGIVAL